MEVGLGVTVFLSQTKINDVDLISTLANAHQKVVGLDITVDERFGVNVLNTRNKLIGKKQDRLQREFPIAEVEQVLQAGTKKIEYHGIVVTFSSEPADERDTDPPSEGFVNTGFIFKLRVLGLDALELDGNLFPRDDVGAYMRVRSDSIKYLRSDPPR